MDGNHVVLDLGGGRYAFYAHLRKGSVAVHPGDRVRRGQVLAKVGNTGNTSAPHLHFHLMDGPSVLGSEGIPYVIDRFALAGKIPDSGVPDDLSGDFRGHLAAEAARANGSSRSTWTSSISAAERDRSIDYFVSASAAQTARSSAARSAWKTASPQPSDFCVRWRLIATVVDRVPDAVAAANCVKPTVLPV